MADEVEVGGIDASVDRATSPSDLSRQEPSSRSGVDLPEFPVFELGDPEMVFGCKIERYIPRYECSGPRSKLRAMEKVANELFFNGGKLADHGIEWKPEIDGAKAMRCIKGMLCSFAPAHEQKTTTIALALHHWTQPIAASHARQDA